MSTTSTVSLRRNNDNNSSLIRRPPPPMVAGTTPPPPRSIITLSGFPLSSTSAFAYGSVADADLDLSTLPPPPPPFRGSKIGNGVVTVSGYLQPSSFDHGGTDVDPFNYLLPPLLRDNYTGKKQARKQSSSRDGDEAVECGYSVKQDEKALQITVDMPGVSKEGAKVYLDGCTLVMKGVRKLDEVEEEEEDDDKAAADDKNAKKKTKAKSKIKSYLAEVDLVPMHIHKVTETKAEMKNGVLKVTVPKVKEEERTDLLHFPIAD